jgi:SAM-dependent methyltransferase
MSAESSTVRAFYRSHHDAITDKRFNSPYPLRRHVHRANAAAILRHVPRGGLVVDVGAGDGALARLVAQERPDVPLVVAVDLSAPNLRAGRDAAALTGLDGRVAFVLADAEHLPLRDAAVPAVVSSHNLEHLPDFAAGARELRRVSGDRVVVGLPTCLSPAAWCLLGGDDFWRVGRRTPFAWLVGLLRVVANLRKDGVDETYGGRADIPHLWFYPWAVRRRLARARLRILAYEAPSLPIPYAGNLRPVLAVQRLLERGRRLPILRACGYGCVVVAEPAADGWDR